MLTKQCMQIADGLKKKTFRMNLSTDKTSGDEWGGGRDISYFSRTLLGHVDMGLHQLLGNDCSFSSSDKNKRKRKV